MPESFEHPGGTLTVHRPKLTGSHGRVYSYENQR